MTDRRAEAAGGEPEGGARPDTGTERGPVLLHRRAVGHALTIVVLVVGLAATASIAFVAQTIHDNNEARLLKQRVREVGTVLTATVGNVQTPLASAATLADADNADPAAFRSLMSSMVGVGKQFASVSLWRVGDPSPKPLSVVGVAPLLGGSGTDPSAVLSAATNAPRLHVVTYLSVSEPRIGFAYAIAAPNARFVAYAENVLPRTRRAKVDRNSAFADLDYALYVGNTTNVANLVATSVSELPIRGRTAGTSAPFGDGAFNIVISSRHELGGSLLAHLSWIVAIVGTILTIGAALLIEWLLRRRGQAEQLALALDSAARENQLLYAEQRSIAETLQHALLPEHLPDIPRVEVASRYVAGVQGVEVGGDWYDVVHLDDNRVFFVVGDVSGRGVRAASIMAALRFSVRAYAVQGDAPDEILTKLTELVSVRDGSFATVLGAVLDTERWDLTIACAGHPSPLLVHDGDATYVETNVGVPVGVLGGARYQARTIALPKSGTLVAFTDGLVERRGESIDVGLARLAASARAGTGSLDDLLTKIVADLAFAQSDDDTAILGLRWNI